MDPTERLIVGLDLPTAAEARAMVRRLPRVRFYKIGLGLLADDGLGLARELKREGFRVFLDLKLFDIPATVARAVGQLCSLGCDFLTVHGDPYVVAAAAGARGSAPTRILAVTFLTSLGREELDDALIVPGALDTLALERARRAFAAGADGVVASPREAARLRALPEAEGRLIVTPGIRPTGSPADDQRRTATPRQAFLAGADHLVVARPILMAPDPAAAAEAILAEL